MSLRDVLGNMGLGMGGAKKTPSSAIPRVLTQLSGSLWDVSLETGEGVIAVVAGKPALVGRYEVPAQQHIALGRGVAGAPIEEKGRPYLYFSSDAPAEITGLVTFYARSHMGDKVQYLGDFHTSELKAGGADYDRTKVAILLESLVKIQQDSYLEMWLTPDKATDDLEQDTCVWQLPITAYPD